MVDDADVLTALAGVRDALAAWKETDRQRAAEVQVVRASAIQASRDLGEEIARLADKVDFHQQVADQQYQELRAQLMTLAVNRSDDDPDGGGPVLKMLLDRQHAQADLLQQALTSMAEERRMAAEDRAQTQRILEAMQKSQERQAQMYREMDTRQTARIAKLERLAERITRVGRMMKDWGPRAAMAGGGAVAAKAGWGWFDDIASWWRKWW